MTGVGSAAGFSRVLAAESISNFGSMLSRLALPWVAALVLDATPWQMAALLMADVIAAALGALLLASWIDRRGKRAVMLLADGLRCALLALLALAAWRGWIGMAMLVACAAANGLLTVGFNLARSAWVAQSVSAAELPRRNAQLSAAGSVSETAAFALGGWLYQGLGVAWSLLVDAISYAVSALALRGVQEVPAAQRSEPVAPGWRALRNDSLAGLRIVMGHRVQRPLALTELLLAFGMSLAGTSYMIYVSRDLALPTGVLGMVFALGGLGAVFGAAFAPRLGRRVGPGAAMSLGRLRSRSGRPWCPWPLRQARWRSPCWRRSNWWVTLATRCTTSTTARCGRRRSAPTCWRARMPESAASGTWPRWPARQSAALSAAPSARAAC